MSSSLLNTNLSEVGENLLQIFCQKNTGILEEINLIILPLASKVTIADLRNHPSCQVGQLIACDFKIEEIEQGEKVEGLDIFSLQNIINIDHHSSIEAMYRPVSSANLAIEYIKRFGVPSSEIPIVINHYDCDSVLSALLMRGFIPPLEIFGVAAVAADHNGEPNQIADLLQSFKDQKDFIFSVRNLALFLSNRPLENDAQALLQARLETRKSLSLLPCEQIDKIMLVKTNGRVDAELFPGIYPNAQIVMSYHLRSDQRWEVRLRLGKAAPLGLNLQKLGVTEIDPGFGGRWNAGSNERGGGTALDPREYCQRLSELVNKPNTFTTEC